MPSITLTVSDQEEAELKGFSWVNWSEVARESMLHEEEQYKMLEKIDKSLRNSKMTDELAIELGRELRKNIYKRIMSERK
jgi:hypothetical protein